jgi:nitrite reductase/ring-hydroxylating ferredoxin subunit
MVAKFVKVATTPEVPPGVMKMVQVAGREVLLANVDGECYAMGNVCTHEEGPLDQGRLEEYEVECPWHGSRFNIRTGQVMLGPTSRPEPVYEVKLEGTNILIRPK